MSAPTIRSAAPARTVDQLFNAAFSKSRDPRSGEYMDGARAALAFRIEGARIGRPYQVGTAAADAFYSGIEEGHAIWRRAGGAESVTAGASASNSTLSAIQQQARDIDAQAGDIEILLTAAFEKLDELPDLPAAVVTAFDAVNCFATCALRNAALITDAAKNIVALVAEGGAV